MSAPPKSALLRNARPRATLVIEWENALDAQNTWVRLALTRLEAEVERIAEREPPPPVLFVYDQGKASEGAMRALIAEVTPRLGNSGLVRLVPNPGLTYYALKNYGARLAESDIVLLADSDTGPLAGWYDAMLQAFDDPQVVAVGGMTLPGIDTLMSRIFALIWFHLLPHEGDKVERKQHVHANNMGVRREFFLRHPFPALAAFKQGQTVWQQELRRAGYKIPVTAKAQVVHAPPTEFGYWTRRAWQEGGDRDFTLARRYGPSRLLRLLLAPAATARMAGRGIGRIFAQGRKVSLPLWAYPLAVGVALAYQLCAFSGQLVSVVRHSRRHDGVEQRQAPLQAG
jgi:hypothetical protein